jgi:uncharacterized protein YqcC (DUF446 family)
MTTVLYFFNTQILSLICPMTDRPEQIAKQILKIEITMQRLKLYASVRPDDSAFESSTPFCYDTMSFLEWIQWVMFPKTLDLITRNLPLPTVCEIHPLAEEEFKLLAQETDELLEEILQLDRLFNIAH